MKANKGVQGTLHKVSGPLTPDVGTRIYMATARTMDLRPLRRNYHDRAGMIWEAKPGTANENGCQQDVPPLRATSGAKVNADVRSTENMKLISIIAACGLILGCTHKNELVR